jgi:hypothetical protein
MQKVGLEKVRATLSSIIDKTAFCNERYIFCRNFKPMAVLVSWDDWQVIEAMYREIDEKRTLKE